MNKEINKILIAGTEYDIRDSRFDEASEAETARQSAETARQEAEQGRVTAEQQRADAEAARAEEFAGFSTAIAAKEDVANKVTSINADADDTHYPSARAVKDSLAKVKNIEVTPAMLSESTKQFINASGGGTITNFADDEDLTTVDNALKLADKAYDPITYSGMGRKYLRKNFVDGKNILTQEMLPSANTIYIIQYDYDLNGATINVPSGCVLDFQGGSFVNGTLNLNDARITNRGICCDISNITKDYRYPLSFYLGNTDNPTLNKNVVQALLNDGINLIIDYTTIEFDSELFVGTIRITTLGNRKSALNFPNSRGFVWNKQIYSSGNNIQNISVNSKGHCFDFCNSGDANRPRNVFDSIFYNISAVSAEGDCFNSGFDNTGSSGDNLSFSNSFNEVAVKASAGCGFVGQTSNTTEFRNIIDNGCAVSLFHNCAGTFRECNGTFGVSTTFFKLTPKSATMATSVRVLFEDCNIESYKGILFDCPSVLTYINLTMRNCSLYITPNSDGLVDYFPIQLGVVRRFEMVNCSTYIYKNGTYADGFYLMKIFGSNETIINSSITYKQHDNSIQKPKVYPFKYGSGVTKATFNTEAYNKFDNIEVVRNIRYGDLIATNHTVELSGNTHIKLDVGYKMLTLKTPSDLDTEGYICKIGYLDINLYDEPLAYYGYTLRLYNASKYSTFRIVHNDGYGDRFLCDIGEDVYIRPGEYVDVTKITKGNAPFRYSFVRSYNFSKFFKSGATRPTLYLHKGKQFFDTTLNKPIWWTGSAWVDATGATV